MKITEIPVPELKGDMRQETRELRMRSPKYLASLCLPLHEQGVFSDIQDIADIPSGNVSALGGGIISACFLIKDKGADVVLKMRKRGVDAEVEWLQKAQAAGVSVPKVLAYGLVPGEEGQYRPVKYIALEAIKDSAGELAKIGYGQSREQLKGIATEMGSELAKIHTIESDRLFGGYADMWGADHPTKTWSEYLINNLGASLIVKLGIPLGKRYQLISAINSIKFPEKGVYTHGDFGRHNTLVISAEPPKIVIFDPNPLIADPYFDLATQFNRMELKRAKYFADKNNLTYKVYWESEQIYFEYLMKAYKVKMGCEIDPKRLAANQLVKLKHSILYEQDIDSSKLSPEERTEKELELKLKKQLLKEKVDLLCENSSPVNQVLRRLGLLVTGLLHPAKRG